MFRRTNTVLCVAVFALVMWVGMACAAKDATVNFTQASEDCAAIAQWELHAALVGTGDPVPADAQIAGLITTPTGACGLSVLTAIVTTTLPAGNTRFWIRTVGVNGLSSNFSNAVDTEVPLNAPVIVEILFQ